MSVLHDYIEEAVEKHNKTAAKKLTAAEWLANVAANAAKCWFGTHIGKFTAPSVDGEVVVYQKRDRSTDDVGYLHTASVDCDIDKAVSSAAFMPTVNFLLLELEDGRTVLEHLQADTADVRDEIKQLLTGDYKSLREQLLSILRDAPPQSTADNLRQVYFPVADGYHLLTTMTSSSVLFELKKRLQVMEDDARDVRNEKSPRYRKSYHQVCDLTIIGFGGNKPQNVSVFNSNQGGKAYLLPSLPPEITRRDIALPRRDFFTDTLWSGNYEWQFQLLDRIMKLDRNNVEIRRKRVRRTADIVDSVMLRVYALRALAAGWSEREGSDLPFSQRVWLDERYSAQRAADDEWAHEIADRFTRWFFYAYKKSGKEYEAVELGDAEFRAIKDEILPILLADRG